VRKKPCTRPYMSPRLLRREGHALRLEQVAQRVCQVAQIGREEAADTADAERLDFGRFAYHAPMGCQIVVDGDAVMTGQIEEREIESSRGRESEIDLSRGREKEIGRSRDRGREMERSRPG
jgi:hypothetical protein